MLYLLPFQWGRQGFRITIIKLSVCILIKNISFYQITRPVMIHLLALRLVNEFMPLSLGEEDLVIHKMMPLSAYLMLRWSRERNPFSASLVLVSPSSCVWCCKRADHCLFSSSPVLLGGSCLVSEPLRSGETTVCSGKPHTFVPSQTGAAYSVPVQKLLHWLCLVTTWICSPILQQKIE